MKLSIALAGALAATAMAAPYSRCKLNGKVVDCNKMAEGLEAYADRYYKAHPEELEKINKAFADMKKQTKQVEIKN